MTREEYEAIRRLERYLDPTPHIINLENRLAKVEEILRALTTPQQFQPSDNEKVDGQR